jgi:hypothetical protein
MDKKLIKEDISNMKFLMGYKAGKVISEQENQGSKRKALSLSEFWQLQIDSHFQHVLDNVLKEPFDENNLEKYFDKMVEYIKYYFNDDVKNVYYDYELGFDIDDIDSSFKNFKNAVQEWEYTKDDEEPSFEEEDDFLHSFGKEMGMFDDADDEDYNFHNRGFDEK